MNRSIKKLMTVLFLAWVGLACPVTAGAAELIVSVGAAQGAPGQEVEVPIHIKGAADLGALELRLTYDPAVLEAREVERGPLAADVEVMDFKAGDGRAGMGLAGTKALGGDGVVLKVRFLVRGHVGQKCPLILEAVRAWQGEGQAELPVQTQPAEFAVTGAPFPLDLILLGTAGALVLVLLWLALGKRRARPAVHTSVVAAPAYAAAGVGYGVAARPQGVGPMSPAGGMTFKHVCGRCGGVIQLPVAMLGRQFVCSACRQVQVGGQ